MEGICRQNERIEETNNLTRQEFDRAPFLCYVSINVRTNGPLELIPMGIHAGEEFDRENAALDEDYERAINNVEIFVHWLWGISKNKLGRTNFLI